MTGRRFGVDGLDDYAAAAEAAGVVELPDAETREAMYRELLDAANSPAQSGRDGSDVPGARG